MELECIPGVARNIDPVGARAGRVACRRLGERDHRLEVRNSTVATLSVTLSITLSITLSVTLSITVSIALSITLSIAHSIKWAAAALMRA